MQRHPQVRIELEDLRSEDSVPAVHKGAVELAVMGDNMPYDGLETLPCHQDEPVPLAQTTHALAARPQARIDEALALDQMALGRSASLTRQLAAAADAVQQALGLGIVGLTGAHAQRRLLLAMRRRAGRSAAAAFVKTARAPAGATARPAPAR